ncbi:hotdog fold thioesterase [Alicyclobacillus kakegawensis]|uniref:hotdog fold thioesterase n=1 Tax=Alicyclobacillus kakegawensis TaxID=392012 RepID=UPI00082EE24A|nr:hotdog fold thioesterase [Alicyclobacillus kakegawensis]
MQLKATHMMETLGIEVQELNKDRVVMTMPVDDRTRQPYGMLHGGASVALAESAASFGTALNIDLDRQMGVGLEINANHLRPKRDGVVTATAVPVHRGRTTMIWDIRITDEQGRLVCISRCTVAIVSRDRSVSQVGEGQ